jgi:hypothetical protein
VVDARGAIGPERPEYGGLLSLPQQIAQLERLERDEPKTLLEMARQWAAKNMIAAVPFGDVAPPAGAVRTFAWQLDSNWFRDFEGTMRRGGPARVQIFGRQRADGSTRRRIAVHSRHPDTLERGDPRTGGSADLCGRRDRASRSISARRRRPTRCTWTTRRSLVARQALPAGWIPRDLCSSGW